MLDRDEKPRDDRRLRPGHRLRRPTPAAIVAEPNRPLHRGRLGNGRLLESARISESRFAGVGQAVALPLVGEPVGDLDETAGAQMIERLVNPGAIDRQRIGVDSRMEDSVPPARVQDSQEILAQQRRHRIPFRVPIRHYRIGTRFAPRAPGIRSAAQEEPGELSCNRATSSPFTPSPTTSRRTSCGMRLADEEIECFLQGENQAAEAGLMALPIQLQVRARPSRCRPSLLHRARPGSGQSEGDRRRCRGRRRGRCRGEHRPARRVRLGRTTTSGGVYPRRTGSIPSSEPVRRG